jgi:hypothetical protein
LKKELSSKRRRELSIVVEEKEENLSIKRSSSELQLSKKPVTIKDLK